MGGTESKINHPNANVINEVKIAYREMDLRKIEFCLYIIVVLIGLRTILHIYAMHHKTLKKKYISRANDLDRV